MTSKDKKEIVDLFNQGITELVLPQLETILGRMTTIEGDISTMNNSMATKEDIKDIHTQLDTIERKVEAQQLRSDEHGKVFDKIKASRMFA